MRRPVNIPGEFKALDKRDLQLWGISFILITTLALGFWLLHLSLPSEPASYERTILYGQGVLILLTLAYLIQKRSELIRVRLRLIQEKLQRKSLRDRFDTLGNTLAFTTRVGVQKGEERILQYTAEQTLASLRGDQCMIGIQEENQTGPLQHKAHIAKEGITGDALTDEAWEPTSRWILDHDASLLLTEKSTPPEARDLDTHGFRCEIIAAPIRLGGRVRGALVLTQEQESSDARRRFSKYDRRLVEIIANATSAAIENCRMAERLRRRRDQFRKSLKRLRLAQPGVILGERLKAMEELVDKVAHYIANPLTTISGYAQLLGTQDLDEDVKRCLATIGEEVERCTQALNDLKAFAHRPPSEPRSTDLNQLLNQALFLKAYRFSRLSLEVEFDPDPDLGMVVLDPVQVQQAFLNVLTDIEISLEGKKNQHLTVRTETDEKNVRTHFTVQQETKESGDGESPAMPMWVPFTPNAEGMEDTNLTRDIMHAVVRGHGGQTYLDLNSDTGTTTFTIDLPKIQKRVESEPKLAEPALSPPSPGENRHVLVVDDEERILNLCMRVLTKEGYLVQTTVSGQEAMDLLDNNDYDALLVDYHMPDVGGRAIAEHLTRHRPDLTTRLILTTGDDAALDFKALSKEAGARTLAKPFQIQEMLSAVQDAIRQPQVSKTACE